MKLTRFLGYLIFWTVIVHAVQGVGRLITSIGGSNPADGMDFGLLCLLRVL